MRQVVRFGSRIANRLPPPAGSPRCHQGPKSARETARRDETREDRGVEAALRRGMARRGAAVAEHVYESRECAWERRTSEWARARALGILCPWLCVECAGTAAPVNTRRYGGEANESRERAECTTRRGQTRVIERASERTLVREAERRDWRECVCRRAAQRLVIRYDTTRSDVTARRETSSYPPPRHYARRAADRQRETFVLRGAGVRGPTHTRDQIFFICTERWGEWSARVGAGGRVCPRARAFNGRRLLIYVNHARFLIPSVPFIPKRPLTVEADYLFRW